MSLSGASVVTVAGPDWADTQEVRVGGVRADWRINGIGAISAMCPIPDVWLQGIDDYTDRWLRWRSRSGRIWGGIVREVSVHFGQAVELSGASFIDELRNISTGPNYRQRSAAAGTIVKRAVIDAPGKVAIFNQIDADDSGVLLSTEWRADNLYQVVDRIARAANQQYTDVTNADWTRTLSVRQSLGDDKSGDLIFVEGKHFGDGRLVTSTKSLVNHILAKSADRDWQDAPGAIVVDTDSQEARGERQATRRYYFLHSVPALAARARSELETLSTPQIPISFPLPTDERQLAEVDLGDVVRVVSWSANARYLMTVLQIVEDEDSGQTTLVGTAVPEA